MTNVTLSAIVDAYNDIVADYAPEGFEAVKGFKSKAAAQEALDNAARAATVNVSWDSGKAVIVDAMTDDTAGNDDAGNDGAGNDDAPAPLGAHLSDAKGGIAKSGFAYASAEWKAAYPKGTPERDEYRKARRQAARAARKARAKA